MLSVKPESKALLRASFVFSDKNMQDYLNNIFESGPRDPKKHENVIAIINAMIAYVGVWKPYKIRSMCQCELVKELSVLVEISNNLGAKMNNELLQIQNCMTIATIDSFLEKEDRVRHRVKDPLLIFVFFVIFMLLNKLFDWWFV